MVNTTITNLQLKAVIGKHNQKKLLRKPKTSIKERRRL